MKYHTNGIHILIIQHFFKNIHHVLYIRLLCDAVTVPPPHIIFCSGVQYRTKVIPMSLINCSCCPQIHISSRKKDNSSFVNVHTPTFSHMPRERGRRKVEINEPSGIAFQSMVSPYTGKLISVIVKTQQPSLSLSLCIFLYLALVFT